MVESVPGSRIPHRAAQSSATFSNRFRHLRSCSAKARDLPQSQSPGAAPPPAPRRPQTICQRLTTPRWRRRLCVLPVLWLSPASCAARTKTGPVSSQPAPSGASAPAPFARRCLRPSPRSPLLPPALQSPLSALSAVPALRLPAET